MKFTDLFIRRPVLALVVNLLIIIGGLQAIRTLNVRQYPRSENATVTVTTVYIGASRLSTTTAWPLRSLKTPVLTTVSPCLSPLVTATKSPRFSPSRTNC